MSLLIGDFHHQKYELLGSYVDIYRVLEDSSVNVANLKLLDSYLGPTTFDHTLIDFHHFFAKYLESSHGSEIVDFNSINPYPWLFQVGDRKKIDQAMSLITEIANSPLTEIRDKGLDIVYREKLAILSENLGEHVDGVADKSEIILVPLRGGLLVASLLPNFDLRQVVPIDCKRLPVKDKIGHFAFGMSFRYFEETTRKMLYEKYQSVKGGSVKILEVAVGSGITTIGMMLDMYNRDSLPETVRVIAPIVTIPGINLVKKVADQLGVKIEVYTAKCYPKLGNFYKDRNDSVVNSNGDYVIGNASQILEPFLHLEDLDSLFSSGRRIK